MERHCKNCTQQLFHNQTFCSHCGSKWIENRITAKNVMVDFADIYLGFDTRFVRTVKDLCVNPKVVIDGYITGRRIHYVDAIRYMLVAVFFSGIITFVMLKTNAFDQMMDTAQASQIKDPEQVKQYKKITDIILSIMTDYQGILLILTIPILAIIARLTFLGKKYYNFTEQIVFQMYTYAQVMIVTTPISLILLLIYPTLYMSFSFLTFLIIAMYNAFCYKRCFDLNLGQIIKKSILAVFVTITVFTVIMVVFILAGVLVALLLR